MVAPWSLSRLCLLATLCAREACGAQAEAAPVCMAAPLLLTSSTLTCPTEGYGDSAPYGGGLWEVRHTPGKGRGLFAVVAIPHGTRLLVEAPLVTITPPPLVPGVGFSLAVIQPLVATAYARLTARQREEYLSCHEVRFGDEGKDEEEDSEDSGRLLRILRSNAYNTRDDRVALYPKVALINHDCRPNVLNTDLSVGAEWHRIIVAARDIAAGEEIVTTYVPLLADTATRRTRLGQYGFTCMCATCAAAAASATTSNDDQERVRMRKVLDELEEEQQQQQQQEAASEDPPSAGNEPTERRRILGRRAIELATYIADHGFVDYAVQTSRLAAEFAFRAGDMAVAAHWAAVHRADLELAGEEYANGTI